MILGKNGSRLVIKISFNWWTGKFWSVDGDNAAAMRYTEARMDRVASEMLQDLDKNTVDFTPNFDDSLEEPSVLPTQIPNLLMNGSEDCCWDGNKNTTPQPKWINRWFNCSIAKPRHNNREIIENHIKGPDFPTAGFIMGSDGINSAYKTGRGRIVMRGKAQIEENENGKQRIIITELPYQVNKANLVEKIADLVREKKLEGISDLRDESDKDGNRIVVECKAMQ